ncbi:MAG: helix-turn-helix domain-containing protein [Pseudomonadota bacterium]|nr:helix-turn-helix domain-containing protein [Pseudomonadota bacterium]
MTDEPSNKPFPTPLKIRGRAHARPRHPPAGDGRDADFCQTCAFADVCLAVGYGMTELNALHCLVEHVGPFRSGEYVFRDGDPFRSIFAVRAGTVKTSSVDHTGREQVLGFHLPGEVIGLNAIYPDRFPCNAITLENTQCCRFSFPRISALATQMPAVQRHLFRMLSKEIGTAGSLAGDHSADARVAAFLADLSERYAARGLPGSRFHLSMSRADIANYLRLASETVSRVLTRFRSIGLIDIVERELVLRDPPRLRDIGQDLLRG